ncbi:MAG: S-layer homology domain-containing protein [Oscillospiraceae bacterium]|nr:S-layer homology domain-containing protein [Oscillospiraceae bacterium]
MKKIRRQIISGVMAAAMVFSAVPAAGISGIEAMAADSEATAEANALKAAIADVKKRITIPSELDEFSYQLESRYETDFFQLQWYHVNEKSGVSKYVNGNWIQVDKMITVTYYDGMITGYEYFDKSYSTTVKPSFAKLTVEQQEQKAKENFKKLNPDLKGNAVFTRNTSSTNITSATVSYYIERKEYGVEVENNSGSITIDRDTGKLLSFQMSWFADGGTFADATKKISVDEANELYKERKGLYASYEYFENYEYNTQTEKWETERFILPVYRPENDGENEIDAITGEYTSYYDDRKKYSYTDAYKWSNGFGDFEVECVEEEEVCEDEVDAGFSEAELQAIEDESKYISKEKAIRIIKKDKYIVFNDKLVFRSKSISPYTDEKDEVQYMLSIDFRYTSSEGGNIYLTVNMDALTGEIISFSKSYSDYYTDNKPVDIKSAEKTAEAAMNYYLGGKAEQYKIVHTKYEKQPTDYINVRFIREVNGLEADFDYVSLTVDHKGEVTSFNYSYHDMEFPEPELVSEDTAYEKLFGHMTPELKYKSFTDLQMKSHTYLTYIYDSSFLINGLTGERINYNGKPYYTDEKPAEEKEISYSDIKGYKYEKEISTLLAYGIYIEPENGRLNPDEKITIGEFFDLERKLFYFSLPSFKTQEELDAYRNKPLTYAELAKLYVMNYTSCRDAAELEGIYKSPFSDISENHPYCGYIAIAKAKGMASGTNGKFNPSKGITKGECLKMMYDYIEQDKTMKIYEIYKI